MKQLLLFSSFLFLHFAVSAQDLANLKHEVEKIIEFDYDLHLEETEGLWIGVIDSDSTFIFSIGNIESDSLIEFQLGSLSKIFTYHISKEQIAQNGQTSQSSITDYLELTDRYQNIQIQDLYNHQSNLPKEPYFFGKYSTNPDNPYEDYPNELIVPELNKYADLFQSEDIAPFTYGHLNYALLGLACEKLSGKTYCQLVEEKYGQSFPSIQCSDDSKKLIQGYDKSGYPALAWQFPGFDGSEGLSANILDLTNFIRTEVFSDHDDDEEFIKISKQLGFQAPWYVLTLKRSQKIHSFSGTTGTHSVFVCFDKNSESAVVMMRNSGKGILHLPLTILDMVKSSKAKSK